MNLSARVDSSLSEPRRLLLKSIADEAVKRGLPIYLVGGFVRDLLLGRSVFDLDLAVEGDAVPFTRHLANTFGGRATVHPAFHTATWYLASTPFESAELDSLDFASTRTETYAFPAALPTVFLSDITEDLLRRDFTINAMALRLDGDHFGELIDPFHGQSDLRHRLIRVLHPSSFIDDPTRLFRAARYAARYGFRIQPSTYTLIPKALAYVDSLTGERLRHEFDLIFDEPTAATILASLADLGLLAAVRPNLPPFDSSRAALLDARPRSDFGLPVARRDLGYLLWLASTPIPALTEIAARLSFTSDLTKSALATASLLADVASVKRARPSQWTARLDNIPPLAVYAVYLLSQRAALKNYLVKWRHVKPVTTGYDLMALGLTPGPQFKTILDQLRTAYLDGKITTQKQEKRLLQTLLR